MIDVVDQAAERFPAPFPSAGGPLSYSQSKIIPWRDKAASFLST